MKKQLFACALAGVLVVGVAGCGNNSSQSSSSASMSSSMSSSSSAVEQKDTTVAWSNAANAEEAAKGAGIEKFGTFETLTINDIEYKNPTFSYAEGVAQATYESGATQLVVRKGGSGHKAPIADRDITSFAEKWTESAEGLDTTQAGPSKENAVVVTWNEGSNDYGVTYEGTGGEDVTLNHDNVVAVVRAIKDANVAQAQQQNANQQQGNGQQQSDGQQQDNGEPEPDAASSALARTNALAAMGMSGVDANVSWQGDHWLVSFSYNDSFFEVDVDREGGVLDSREYKNGVKVEYDNTENRGVINQDEIDEAGKDLGVRDSDGDIGNNDGGVRDNDGGVRDSDGDVGDSNG